jgi:hypothetical protein
METQVDMSSTAQSTGTESMRAAGTVLGKRSRERYGIYRNHSAGPRVDVTVAMNCGSRLQMGSWRQQGPQRGPAVHLSSGPKQTSMINPRRCYAERRGSRPRLRKEFTTDPCWGLVSRRGQWDLLRRERRLRLRRESGRNCDTTQAARCLSGANHRIRRSPKTYKASMPSQTT